MFISAALPQVLRFTGPVERLFSSWADDTAAQRFKRRLDLYGSIWCCVNAHPGHVWCVGWGCSCAWDEPVQWGSQTAQGAAIPAFCFAGTTSSTTSCRTPTATGAWWRANGSQ